MTTYHLLLNQLTLFIIYFSVCSVNSVAKNNSLPGVVTQRSRVQISVNL